MEGNFRVRKWRTNNKDLQKFINIQEKGGEIAEVGMNQTTGDKVLGIMRRNNIDDLVIDAKSYINDVNGLQPTKRNVLKVTATIYDPLGVYSTVYR